jgi:hypothetical protein
MGTTDENWLSELALCSSGNNQHSLVLHTIIIAVYFQACIDIPLGDCTNDK